MNLSNSLSLLLLSVAVQVQSFAPTNLPAARQIATTSTKLNALTADDILKRARKAAGVEEDEPEQLFKDEILIDFQESLLLLEKRVKQGPGSLSSVEVNDLENRLKNIIQDLKENDNGEAPVSRAMPPPQMASAAPVEPVATSTPVPENDEEGKAYDGEGGLGLATGTANTWVIDGMDEMTGEEYRAALQESVSARQRKRRAGTIGNLSSNNYLDNLN